MKKRILNFSLLTPVLITLLLFFGCKGGGGDSSGENKAEKLKETTEAQSNNTEEEDEVSVKTKAKFDMVIVNNIPSPLEIIGDIEKSNIDFQRQLIYPVNQGEQYVTNFKRSLIFGLYGADLGYLTVNNKSQQAISHFKKIQGLADEIGVGSVFKPELIKRFNNHLGQKDTLVEMIYKAYDRVDKYLRTNKRLKTAALVLIGGWVESIYISTHAVAGQPKDKTKIIYRRVWEQKHALKNILGLLKDFEDDEQWATIAKDLKAIYGVYKSIKRPEQMTTEQMNELKDSVTTLRDKITNANIKS